MTRVGIVGGGQLGRMLALAGYPLGIECVTLDPSEDSPAAQVASALVGAYDDHARLAELAERSDVLTYEFENVPVEAARFAQTLLPVYPPPESLEAAQDRLTEKRLFEKVGLEVPSYEAVDSLEDITNALTRIGSPALLKTRRLGYDGKGQAVIHDPLLAEDAWRSVGELPSLLEAFVGFDRELSIIAVRGRDGVTAAYPLVENHHRDGILRLSLAPAPGLESSLQEAAESVAATIMTELDHVGVLAIELFQVGDRLMGNEMAPRVHNSGHWTDVGAVTSQFENHLRAVTGLPLGSTQAVGVSAMVNLIGTMPDIAAIVAEPGAHLHDYGKEARPGRKLGHITVCADDRAELEPRLVRVQGLTEARRAGFEPAT
ncbi:MAG TPA: 5-(carboxyamino)imidazole ribonucleotide synthase [Actinomycetota bacterium]